LADGRGADAGADAAPEGRVEQDHVDGGVENVRRELLEVDDDRVRRQRDRNLLAHAPHPVQTPGRVLEVVVPQVLDRAPEAHRLLDREHRVRVEANAVLGEGLRERSEALELVIGRKDAALQLVRAEAEAAAELGGVLDELGLRAHLALARLRVRVAEEEVARERYLLAEFAPEQLVDGYTEPLAEQVEAGELDRRVHLHAVVVEAGGRVADLEPERGQVCRVVADQVALQPLDQETGALAAAPELAQPDQTVVGLDLDDRAHEPAPVRAVRVPERRFQWDRHRRRAQILDLRLHELRASLAASGKATPIRARRPPSIRTSPPVIAAARSLARKATSSATSSALMILPSGCSRPQSATTSSTPRSPLKRSAAHPSIGVST